MKNKDKNIKPLNIQDLLSESKYIIPIYQRNYAWGIKEIEQLIDDIVDNMNLKSKDILYYLGTLVVSENNNKGFYTIDGQQRMTTLCVLTAVLKNEFDAKLDWFNDLNLHFESRKKSIESMNHVITGHFPTLEDGTNAEFPYDVNIKAAYDICKAAIEKRIKEGKLSVDSLVSYLYTNVQIVRVNLPEKTDLNHYFEIMNSRGEQLELHEVLKAKLISTFQNSEKRENYEFCFNLIWEACSNMERYSQYGFSIDHRNKIFGNQDWNDLIVNSFDEIVNIVTADTNKDNERDPSLQNKNEGSSIDDILSSPVKKVVDNDDPEHPDRFNTVVNFSHFLLLTLKLYKDDKGIALDDKRLMLAFDKYLSDENGKENFAKEFIFNLLKCKFLFDKYIIKREFTANTDRWVLKCLKWTKSKSSNNGTKYVNTFGDENSDSDDNENRRCLMLLSMFHVSMPSMSHKHWLFAALRYVYLQPSFTAKDYISYLEYIVKNFVYDNYLLQKSKECDYNDMIMNDNFMKKRNVESIDKSKLTYDGLCNNLVFNYIDYLLWLKLKNEPDPRNRIRNFEFSFRSSVEHYYPQNPISGDVHKLEPEVLNSFGNLCLISHEKNSRLNNHTPKAKKDYYNSTDSIDSIKQYLMMKYSSWNIKQIKEHDNEMMNLLEDNINSDFVWNKAVQSTAREWFKHYKQNDRNLLIRTLLCFGRIEVINGTASGMNKYNFYNWEHIIKSGVFTSYENYVSENKPESLYSIINDKLTNDKELRSDSYRYSFVSRPEIFEYCKDGNFGWSDNNDILVLNGTKATTAQCKDLYCLCIGEFIDNKYSESTYCDRNGLNIYLNETENGLDIARYEDSYLSLYIWNNYEGNLCYHINTSGVHGNSKVIRNLKSRGWEANNFGGYYHPDMQYLCKLDDDIENNIVKAEKSITKLLNKIRK